MHPIFSRPLRLGLSTLVLLTVLGCDRNEPPERIPEPTRPAMPSPTAPDLPDPKITTTPPQPQPTPGQNNDHSSPGFKGGPTDPTR